MISITIESWQEIENLWIKLEAELRHWLWLLDSQLPGALGEVGEWLGCAEALITSDKIPNVMNEETASIISRKLEEHKCCLIAFLHLTETKLRGWTVRYGREEKVQQLLEQYRNFVSCNHIFQEFNKAYIDMQQVVKEYKREGNVDQRESINIDRFMRETSERWKNVSMELRCVQSMLEEVVAYWRRWNTNAEEFESWLDQAYGMLDLPEEDKMEYFQHVKQYMLAGDILRHRKDYRAGVEHLQQWLRNAESILSSSQLNSTQEVKVYGEQLQQLQNEVEGIEDLFKNVSKKFQAMIQDLSREEVDRIMNILKKEKEAMVRVRALIPMQLHLFHQILVQQESLEAGQAEIGQWLDEAEAVLASHSLAGGKEPVQALLDKHKAFFSRTLYYKSMLENRNKVFQSIVKSVDHSEGIDTGDFRLKMSQLNEQFTRVTQLAQQCEMEVLSFAPLHLMRLEFRLDESSFNQYLKEIEKEVHLEQQAFNKHEDVDSILTRNQDFFVEKRVLAETERCLANMGKISTGYTQGDASLQDAHKRAVAQWEKMKHKVTALSQQLNQIPTQWKTYQQKFAEMVKWMDTVDGSLEKLGKEVCTLEEFEKEREVFHDL